MKQSILDTCYLKIPIVGTIKGIGRIYQQTVIDTYSRVANAKLYTDKTLITSADTLNDRVIPFCASHHLNMFDVLGYHL